jgi:hypothetical protein
MHGAETALAWLLWFGLYAGTLWFLSWWEV